jgi:hypothetical protein
VVSGIENAANTVVSGVESFTGRVTQTTNPPAQVEFQFQQPRGWL